MSQLQIDVAGLASKLKIVASDLKEHSEELGDLDAKIGDGDLGITITLICDALSAYLSSTNEQDIGKFLAQCGMEINRANPSTFGTILASGFIGGGKAVLGKTHLDLHDLVLVAEGAVQNIKKRGKAEVGGKTLLDVIVPSTSTLKEQAAKIEDIKGVISAAVDAAKEGLDSTITMKARFGRAAIFQDSSIGIQDAGGTAVYYMIESFARHLNSE